jgi:hypothetical protein
VPKPSPGPSGNACWAAIAPRRPPGLEPDDRDAGSVAGHGARSIGAAARQRGSSDGWTLSQRARSSTGSDEQAGRDHDRTTSGSNRPSRRAGALDPEPLASLVAACPTCRPRPRGRSGRVTGTRWRGETPAARARRPRATLSRRPPGSIRPVAAAGFRAPAPPGGRPVDDQDPVEVVGSRWTTRAGVPAEPHLPALGVGGPIATCLALDRDHDARQRQAALVVGLTLVGALGQVRG